ncbi:translation initiation factor IF-2 associated domain-containing protein [Paraburkholderia aspalathi]|uniref:translation initiation factor IF-2 associated domain-containing protein n=1 Tax=Paraburkholderia aspalathi TaxID=1324617 RepID=UPI0038BD2621
MSGQTVGQFAAELKMPAVVLLEQMRAAGVAKESATDIISEREKAKLLDYLRASSSTSGRKISLTRRHVSEVSQKDASGKPRTIQVEVRKKRTFVRRQSPEQVQDLAPAAVTNISVDQLSPQIDSRTKKIRWSKLASVEISNFKAVKNLRVPLSDVTILVGPNGSGKSSVLQAVHWATRAASYIPPQSQSEVVSFERLDYSPSSEPLTTAHRGELSPERSSQPTSVAFTHTGAEDETSSTATVRIWAARNRGGISVHIEGGSAVTPFKQREELITTYIPGLAGLSEKETILVKPLLRRQAAGGDAGGVLRNVLFNIASRQAAEPDNRMAEERLQHLNRLVQMVHPNVRVEVSFDEREDVHIQASFDDQMLSGAKRPLEAAATGVLQIVQIFAYLVLFRPKLILIDEPDAHLHPDKQERLIEALELAADEFDVQVLLTTHSPHIARAASPAASLLWVNNGQVVEEQDEAIRSLLGWGGLDRKILFFVEDENDQAIRALLRQWPRLNRQITICRCFGVDNLPKNALLKGLLGEKAFDLKVVIHRDRDFMTEQESEKWGKKYSATGVAVWVTTDSDAEAYFCTPAYLSVLYDVSEEDASEWVDAAVQSCPDGKRVFFEKRKIINRLIYEDGGSPESEKLWNADVGISAKNILGKTLHRSLKNIVKASGFDDKKLDRFLVPTGHELAPELRQQIERLLQ